MFTERVRQFKSSLERVFRDPVPQDSSVSDIAEQIVRGGQPKEVPIQPGKYSKVDGATVSSDPEAEVGAPEMHEHKSFSSRMSGIKLPWRKATPKQDGEDTLCVARSPKQVKDRQDTPSKTHESKESKREVRQSLLGSEE